MSSLNHYQAIIEKIFFNHFENTDEFEFDRAEIEQVAAELEIPLPKNVGDIIYSFRYRNELPASVCETANDDKEWVIQGAGRAKYQFKLVKQSRIEPRPELVTIKIPDATPEIISAYALNDEQALLAIVRYNRLVDIFLGITAFSLQNHLRTTVEGVGQIEIDEIYVGLDRQGRQFVVPVQAKGGTDKHGVVQSQQDIQYCAQKFPDLICRAVSAQFMNEHVIAMFELAVIGDELKVIDEKHYQLVPSAEISAEELRLYTTFPE